mgnify:CR=1 FL=1
MRDPKTVAFEIYLGKKKKKNGHYKSPFITIWHNDPETDGTDDSCGWFIREKHLPKDIVDKVIKDFEFKWDKTYTGENGFIYNSGWFNPEGENILSVRGIVLNMYLWAFKIMIDPNNENPGKAWDKTWKFLNKNYAEIMYFAENNIDSIRDRIVRKFEIGCGEPYTKESREEMIKTCAYIITCDIARRLRPWYKHPKWHIHHWSIQFHPWQNLKRRYWDKCCKCGKRGFKGSAMSDWGGTKIWHWECDNIQPIKTEDNGEWN